LSFLAAVRFLTVIRLPWGRQASPQELGRSVVYFPVVGIIIGLILAGLNWLLVLVLPQAVVSALLLAGLVGLTGAMHLDGFIDTCDGLGGRRTPEARRQAMSDSRVGGFGVIGAVLLLLVKYASLSRLPLPLMTAALVLMALLGRWAMVYAIFAYPYAKPSGLGLAFKAEAGRGRFVIATVVTLAAAVFLAWWGKSAYFYLAALVIMGGVWVMAVAVACYLRGKFSGLTGDTYGAINELAEVVVLLLVLLLAHNRWLGMA
jgi:adenosylcobinamide-GDP ribazoletransferase